ncbi:archease [Streptomyces sp. NPDC052687]|uniref:archease n=1 Tax=unclassified Streptomyces TaxID=2593676 RepID=UPI00140B954A|nr:archease [Streptomyces sp. JB150]QIJ60961.1 archease [Streptomyces sp. JB150]
MVGDTDDDIAVRRRGTSGHRASGHTADVRIEAWGADRDSCLLEAVRGLVECFADVTGARPSGVSRARLPDEGDEELLAALLDEVVYRLEVRGEVPVDVAAGSAEGALDVRFTMADLDSVEITGAVPKAVAWHELRIRPDAYGWSCTVTVDV